MTDEEDVTAQLLRLVGAPSDPPAERAARVREAVHREWRVGRHRRVIRRNVAIGFIGLAAVLTIAVVMNRSPVVVVPSTVTLATGQRVQGRPQIIRQHDGVASSEALAVSTSVHANEVIETDNESRAALQMADGSSMRIDRASRVRLAGTTMIEVIAGAVYVATVDGSRGFEVRTPKGTVRDVGTQFEVRLTDGALRLRVRTGRIEIHRGTNVDTASAGTEATVTSSGMTVRQVPAYGSDWEWTADVAPSFAIEGHSLRSFLEHIAAEEGWTLRYSERDVADLATRVILHGSVEGLKAEEALGVVLPTSGLEYRLRDGELLVSRRASAR
jgi:ferric-dicitrate binding protein FerR (iron transport regulator)